MAVRDYRRMEHLRQVLGKTNLRRHDIVVMSVRTLSTGAGEYELTDAVRELALAGKKVQALEIAGDWADVRDPEILAQLNQ